MLPWPAIFLVFSFSCSGKGDDTDYYYDTYALNGDTETRIVGGSPIEITKAPYQVSLELKQYGNFEHRCGASILSKQWVITAAHCIKGIAKDRFRIRAGSTFLETGGTLHYITSYTTHENYNRSGRDYDVAVMKLSEPFVYSDKVKPIPLATKEPMYGQQVWVSGWGRTAHRGSVSPQLRVVDLKIISRGPCNVPYQWQITPRMICALAPEGGKDSCQGDSGGPMVVNNQLVGIVSWGKKCAEKDVPGVYTNVKVFRGWIQNAIGLPITDGSPVPQWRATQNNGANSQCKGNRRCDWHWA